MEMNNKNLNYNIKLNYNPSGKDLYQIIKEHFLIYIKELKKDKENKKTLIRNNKGDPQIRYN